MKNIMVAALGALALTACQGAEQEADYSQNTPAEEASDNSGIELGNGENNSITTEGITRIGSVFTVPEVPIAQNGWLIMHPFRDGAPVGNEYVGATLVKQGTQTNVTIDIGDAPMAGDMFIIMLHNDVNDDGVFDFGDGGAQVTGSELATGGKDPPYRISGIMAGMEL